MSPNAFAQDALDITARYVAHSSVSGRLIEISWTEPSVLGTLHVEIEWSTSRTGPWTQVQRGGCSARPCITGFPLDFDGGRRILSAGIALDDTGTHFFRVRYAGSGMMNLPWSNVVGTDDAAADPGDPRVVMTHPIAYISIDGEFVFDVRIGGPLNRSFSLWYNSTLTGTARPYEHYRVVSGRLDFAAGETAKQIRVPIVAMPEDRIVATMNLRLSYDASRRRTAVVSQGIMRCPAKFPGTRTTRSFTETEGNETVETAENIGSAITATDANCNIRYLTYSLEGTDSSKFTIDSSGQLRTRVGESYDREYKSSYSVMVKAVKSYFESRDTIAVTINVTDVSEPPVAPSSPSVSSTGATNLNVSWDVSANAGRPAITGYKVQYRQGTRGNWTDFAHSGTGTNATIAVADVNAQHQVRVRETNSDGDGPWSQPGSNVAPQPTTEEQAEEQEVEVEEGCAVSGVRDDKNLMRFVECAAGRIAASETFGETLGLFEQFRDGKGNWNDGSTYLVLLTKRSGVYFHATDREAEDLDWSGILFCEGGVSVAGTRKGCFIEYKGERSGYAHPLSASHVPLAHGEEEFILVGGFDEATDGEAFTGEIGVPSTEAGEVDTDEELREFVEEVRRVIGEAVEDPDIDPAQMRGILRREGPWRKGNVYVYIMDETGRVIFDGEDRSREQKDESAKQYVRDLIAEADGTIVEYTKGDLLRRGYAVRVEVALEGEDNRVYVVGSGYRVEKQPNEEMQPGESDSGGCAVGRSDSGGAFGIFLAALALLLICLA